MSEVCEECDTPRMLVQKLSGPIYFDTCDCLEKKAEVEAEELLAQIKARYDNQSS